VFLNALDFSGLLRSHDNAKFASAGGDRSVFVWDVATGVTNRRLAGHMSKVHTVEFNTDASVLASGERRYLLVCPPRSVHHTSSGSYDATVRLWDLRCGSFIIYIEKYPS
jgi:mitogen-activated protein kinase organizer 1